MKFERQIKDHEARAARARTMGGEAKLAKRRQAGQLNARERIDRAAGRQRHDDRDWTRGPGLRRRET